jgi:hypothetical protein
MWGRMIVAQDSEGRQAIRISADRISGIRPWTPTA